MTVLIQRGDAIGEVGRGLIEEVHAAVGDLVQLIKAYQSKNKLSKVLLSTVFKRRQAELDAVVHQAIGYLQVSDLQQALFTRLKCGRTPNIE